MDSMEVNKGIAAVLVAGIALLSHRPDRRHPGARAAAGKAGAEHRGGADRGHRRRRTKPAALPPIAPLLASADPAAGEAIAKKVCVACHTFTKGGKAGVGPNLYGVVGAPHGHMEGFNYTAGLKGKQGPWTYDELNEWLYKPSAYRAGHAHGVRRHHQRQAARRRHRLSAHLSDNPEPLPSPDAGSGCGPSAGRGSGSGGACRTEAVGHGRNGKPARTRPVPGRAPKPRPTWPAPWCGRSSAPASPSTRSPIARR